MKTRELLLFAIFILTSLILVKIIDNQHNQLIKAEFENNKLKAINKLLYEVDAQQDSIIEQMPPVFVDRDENGNYKFIYN